MVNKLHLILYLTIKGNILNVILYMYCHLVALNTKRESYKIPKKWLENIIFKKKEFRNAIKKWETPQYGKQHIYETQMIKKIDI